MLSRFGQVWFGLPKLWFVCDALQAIFARLAFWLLGLIRAISDLCYIILSSSFLWICFVSRLFDWFSLIFLDLVFDCSSSLNDLRTSVKTRLWPQINSRSRTHSYSSSSCGNPSVWGPVSVRANFFWQVKLQLSAVIAFHPWTLARFCNWLISFSQLCFDSKWMLFMDVDVLDVKKFECQTRQLIWIWKHQNSTLKHRNTKTDQPNTINWRQSCS